MRINRLDLTRFGLFTDISLDLSAPGTHLVLGHNEAGKTTAMAAIEQLLYGIPVRTTHAFHHEMRDLRLGALLADDEGKTLEIVRVKKQSNTLQAPEAMPFSTAMVRSAERCSAPAGGPPTSLRCCAGSMSGPANCSRARRQNHCSTPP